MVKAFELSVANSLNVDTTVCLNNQAIFTTPNTDPMLIAKYTFDDIVASDFSGNANHLDYTVTMGPSSTGSGASAYIRSPITKNIGPFRYTEAVLYITMDVWFPAEKSAKFFQLGNVLNMTHYLEGILTIETQNSGIFSTSNVRSEEWIRLALRLEPQSIVLSINEHPRVLCVGPTCHAQVGSPTLNLALDGDIFLDNLVISHSKNILPPLKKKHRFGCYSCGYQVAQNNCAKYERMQVCTAKQLYEGGLKAALESHWFENMSHMWHGDSKEAKTSVAYDALCCA